jgi:type II secretory pathway component PulF
MSQPPSPPPSSGHPDANAARSAGFARMLIAHLAIMAFLTFFHLMIVPGFTKVFKDFDAQLPAMTLVLIDLSNWTKYYWYVLAVFVLPLYVAALYFVDHRSRTASKIWTYGLFVLMVLHLLFAAVALGLPLTNQTRLT